MPVAIDRARATLDAARNQFTEPEMWRLLYLEATIAAEQCLIPANQRCQDHQTCRRLAFGLWLRLTGRISEEVSA